MENIEDRTHLFDDATNLYLTATTIEATDDYGVLNWGALEGKWLDIYQKVYAEHRSGSVKKSANFTIPFSGYRYRCNLSNSNAGFGLSMRRLPLAPPSFHEDLQLDWNVIEPLTRGTGLTLFAGQMGCGKSTTMSATIEKMDRRTRGPLGTCEDPIEIVYSGPGIIQREVGTHVESFEDAIRNFVRQNRTTIVVGEIRDFETANAALLAASTGHSVFGTIHADSAIDIVTRMYALIDSKYSKLLSRSLRGLWWQHVLRFGDRGRRPVPVYESIEVTLPVRQIIDAGPEKFPLLAQEMVRQNRMSMSQTAMELVRRRLATREEVSIFTLRRDRVNDF